MAGGDFDKDFGYLMPFLDKVAAAAPTLSDEAARQELARLISGEKERWARIRQLLSGENVKPAVAAPAARLRAAMVERREPPAPERPSLSFTVGSLRRRE